MSQMRQAGTGLELLVRTLAAGYSSGTVLDPHIHGWAQLVYASAGVMTVQTATGTWVVPSHRAVWIPAGIEHSIAMSGRVAMRSIYIEPTLSETLPQKCFVVAVTSLLRELILHTVSKGMLRADDPEQYRLAAFLLDQLHELPTVPLELPVPRDQRALRVALRLRTNPGDAASVDELGRDAGASRRTLERLFQQETGMSFGRWRQQARLLEAMRLLAQGESVTTTALAVGYDTPSAFIAAFSTALGTTPGRYYRQSGGDKRGSR